MTIIDFPRYAEVTLQQMCARYGALCHSVDQDKSGWDRLIEFGTTSGPSTADEQAARKLAFVQVKSITTNKNYVKIKLSNALNSVKSHHPWFVVIFVHAKHSDPKVYAIHLWEEFIKNTLELVRIAETQGVRLNRKYINLKFSENNFVGNNLIAWMLKTIEACGPDYTKNKKIIDGQSGYDNGMGVGSITVSASSDEEILGELLGLGNGLDIKHLSYTPARFGIKSTRPEFEASAGKIHFEPLAPTPILAKLRSTATYEGMSISGLGFATPVLANNKYGLRFVVGCMELVSLSSGPNFRFTIKFDPSKRLPLEELYQTVKLYHWISVGEVDVQIWIEGQRAMAGAIQSKPIGEWEWDIAAQSLEILKEAFSGRSIEISISELGAIRGLKTLTEVVTGKLFRVQFPNTEITENNLKNVVYRFTTKALDHQICLIVRRPILRELVVDEVRDVFCANASILDVYAIKYGEIETDKEDLINADYERHVAFFRESGGVLDLGDLRQFLEARNQSL